jgi:two-component system, NtrC family, response regulator HydG
MERILVIDDDVDINNLLKRFLTKHGYEVETAFGGVEGEKLVNNFNPNLVMCDYRLDDMDGTVLLSKIKQQNPSLPVIIITGYSDLRTAVRVVRMGAFDYITKPLIPDEILLTIKRALEQSGENKHESSVNGNGIAHSKTPAMQGAATYHYLWSDSIHSQNLDRQISLVAPTNYSVIIYGESGSGKEGVARLIHEKSKRSDKPFVAMDCGAMSKELAGSEMFGHEKGSFTGALNQKTGHFEVANGGTLFLDEVANLPYEIQTLLLRVIQEKKMRRVGGNKETDVDVRLIVACNERLSESIRKGKFREDLYHRLNEFSIDVPSLRDRKDDILFFARHFLKEISAELGKPAMEFTPEVEEVFQSYPWYGNIRELKNIIKRATLLSIGDKLDIKTLPFEILNHAHLEFGFSEADNSTGAELKTESVSPRNSSADEKLAESAAHKLKDASLEAEYEMILATLNKVNFNKSKAAELLGVNRKTLYNKMKQMKLKK